MHTCRLNLFLSPKLSYCLHHSRLQETNYEKRSVVTGSAASDIHVRREVQEAGIRDGATIPPARRSGNGNLSGGGDDLRGAAWWLVPQGEEEREAKGEVRRLLGVYTNHKGKGEKQPRVAGVTRSLCSAEENIMQGVN